MPRPKPLPSDLPPTFTVAEALAAGVQRGRLTRDDLRRPFYGVRSVGERLIGPPLLVQCLEYLPRLKPWQFYSHETALYLVGAPTPEWPYEPSVHVASHRPSREPRVTGVRGHRLQLREAATLRDANGIPLEHPVRAWRQVGMLWTLDDLIAAGDYLVSGSAPLATVAELRDEVRMMGDMRRGILRSALCDVRTGVRSARETKLRLRLVRAGLPEPELSWVLRDRYGGQIAELDLAYPTWRVAAEYDGRVHAVDAQQFAKDADRWDRIRAEGWDHVRILSHHMRGSGGLAVAKVRDALIRAGWRPGR